MKSTFPLDLSYAQHLDQQDELIPFRRRFVTDDSDLIYLDGNSLGRLPLATRHLMQQTIDDAWGRRLIRSWNEGWFTLPERIGGKIARLLGAQPDEVVVADSTSVNLFKLALAALEAQPERHKIITDDLNFPSDLYVLQSISRLRAGSYVQVVASSDGIHGPVAALAEAIDGDTALVVLSHTTFKSSFVYDMTAVTQLAHQSGAIMLWDLSHSAGSVFINLNEANVDLAVGCTYKYLNGGPGAPAFLYVRRNWQDKLNNPIAGWMGQHRPFDFGLDYAPEPDLRRFLSGTPPILSLAAIEAGVDLLLEAGMDNIRAKSVQQSEYLIDLWRQLLAPIGFRLNSPSDSEQRGSHISLGHEEGWRINLALIDQHILPDFRRPDNIRLGITPLYTTYEDLWTAVTHLRTIVTQKQYQSYSQTAHTVT
ncbi:MAG: kynureninase [Ardenticatenaceae bacterium]|nr:kynureninase [Ardenticatenaceae bacterium]MCB9443128.1 kynureninase [Ardenticatenaceae bacterium]